jgi:hypothetical protein
MSRACGRGHAFGGITATAGTPLALRFPGQWLPS